MRRSGRRARPRVGTRRRQTESPYDPQQAQLEGAVLVAPRSRRSSKTRCTTPVPFRPRRARSSAQEHHGLEGNELARDRSVRAPHRRPTTVRPAPGRRASASVTSGPSRSDGPRASSQGRGSDVPGRVPTAEPGAGGESSPRPRWFEPVEESPQPGCGAVGDRTVRRQARGQQRLLWPSRRPAIRRTLGWTGWSRPSATQRLVRPFPSTSMACRRVRSPSLSSTQLVEVVCHRRIHAGPSGASPVL